MAKGQRRQGAKRDPRLEVYWRGVLGRFGKSGLGVRGFCRREKLSEPAFYAWRRVVRERDAERRPRGAERQPSGAQRTRARQQAVPAFVPVVVRGEPTGSTEAGITIELRGGRVLRLPVTTTADRVGELVRAVESVAAEARP